MVKLPRRSAEAKGGCRLAAAPLGGTSLTESVSRKTLGAYIGDTIFVVEFKTQGDAASAAMAARRTRQVAEQLKMKATPLVAVTYMGEVGQRLCDYS